MRLMSVFAHQDDETFSAGGTLALYGKNAYAVSITFDPKREKEFIDACEILGISPIQLKFPNITHANKNDIRNKIIELIRKIKPDIIITHLDYDYHHEHRLTRDIVEDAVEWASHTTVPNAHQVKQLWAAETTILIPFPEIFINISKVNEKRESAIKIYETQSYKGGNGFYHKFHHTRTKLRGLQAEVEHAEAFVRVPISIAGAFKPKKVFEAFPIE